MQRHRIAYVPTLKLSLCSFEIHGAKIKNDPPSVQDTWVKVKKTFQLQDMHSFP